MNATKINARSSNVPAVVTVIVAGWFVLASGMAFAETAKPAVPAANPVTLTPSGTMKLTVVAARPATQVALTPEGTMKLTVVANRDQASRVQTATARQATRS